MYILYLRNDIDALSLNCVLYIQIASSFFHFTLINVFVSVVLFINIRISNVDPNEDDDECVVLSSIHDIHEWLLITDNISSVGIGEGSDPLQFDE